MANVDILQLSDSHSPASIDQIKDIFFLTSARKLFISEDEKNDFFKTWTHYYFEAAKEFIFLACPSEAPHTVAGYLTGCTDSLSAGAYFNTKIKSYDLFADQFAAFPAHLHINCHPKYQGLGIGQKLLEAYFSKLESLNVPGVHAITSAHSRNVDFYRRNGFDTSIERDFNSSRLRFMGRRF